MWKSVKPILSTVFYGLSLNFTARPWGTLVPKLAKHVSFIFSAEDQSWPNLKFQETMLSNIIWNSGEIAVWHTLFFQYVLYDISNKNIIKSQSFIIALVLQGELRTLSVLVINSVIAKCSVNWNLFVNLSIRRAATGVSWSRSCARPRSVQVWDPHNPNSNPAAAAAEAVLATTLASPPISVMRCSWPMQLQAPPLKFKAKALFYWTKQRCMLRQFFNCLSRQLNFSD